MLRFFLYLILISYSLPAIAQIKDIGRWEYENQCAVCHGDKGKGDGPLSQVLNQPVADLTILKKTNNGVFPSKGLYEIIDGRKMMKAHGSREMPVWGKRLGDQALFWLGPTASPEKVQSFVKSRIKALINHLAKLQKN